MDGELKCNNAFLHNPKVCCNVFYTTENMVCTTVFHVTL